MEIGICPQGCLARLETHRRFRKQMSTNVFHLTRPIIEMIFSSLPSFTKPCTYLVKGKEDKDF
jgi:hypothetical protein